MESVRAKERQLLGRCSDVEGGYTILSSAPPDDTAPTILPHSSQLAALPAVSDFAESPLIVTGDPRVKSQVIAGSADPSAQQLPLDQIVTIQSDYFQGVCKVHLKGLGSCESVFRGNRWLGKTVIQGRFRKRMTADDLWVGQELWNTLPLPASFQKLVFTTAAKLFSSTCRVCSDGEGAGFLNPLLAMAHVVNVSKEGQQPHLDAATEDMRLLSSRLADKHGRPLSSAQRKKYCDKPANLAALVIEPTHIFTLVIYQGLMDLSTYRLSLGGLLSLNLDLAAMLNGQPTSILCKNVRDNQPVVSLLMWHKRLNYPGQGCCGSSSSGGDRFSDGSIPSDDSSVPSSIGGSCSAASLGHSSSSGSCCSSSSGGDAAGWASRDSPPSSAGCSDSGSEPEPDDVHEQDHEHELPDSDYASACSELSAWSREQLADLEAALEVQCFIDDSSAQQATHLLPAVPTAALGPAKLLDKQLPARGSDDQVPPATAADNERDSWPKQPRRLAAVKRLASRMKAAWRQWSAHGNHNGR